MRKADRSKTIFASGHEYFQVTKTPARLRDTTATFQQTMDVILLSVEHQQTILYLHDVLVLGKELAKHSNHDLPVHTLFREAVLLLELNSNKYFRSSSNYLGQFIEAGQIHVVPRTSDTKGSLNLLTTVMHMKPFYGFFTVFRRLSPVFTLVSVPLNRKLRKGKPRVFRHLPQNGRYP